MKQFKLLPIVCFLLKGICLILIAGCRQLPSGSTSDQDLKTDSEIVAHINAHRPMKGATIPADIKRRLGASHVDGKYYLTKQPFIVEGSQQMQGMGLGVAKLFFTKGLNGYHFNSDWQLPAGTMSLKQLAQHPYYKACFEMEFSTIVLLVDGAALATTDESAIKEEEEIHELTAYLLNTYKNRKVTFVLQNWEGDWLFRAGTGLDVQWSLSPQPGVSVKVPDDIPSRKEKMVKWFTARQRGIERARTEFGKSKCKVFHAIEVNKVMDAIDGIPGIVNDILPEVETDMVSWSSYDAVHYGGEPNDGVNLYKGIQYIKSKIKPAPIMDGKKVVYLGEVGIPEQSVPMDKELITNSLDAFLGVVLALDVPYSVYWELYCNEPKNPDLKDLKEVRKSDEMRGFWLIRPDGSKSHAGEYYTRILSNAGKKLVK